MSEQPAPYRIARPAALVDDYSELGERLQTSGEHYFACYPGDACLACSDWFDSIARIV